MTSIKKTDRIKRSLLYTSEGVVGDESELKLAQLGPENPISGSGIVLESCLLERVRVTAAPAIRLLNCELNTIDGANAVLNESSWRKSFIIESRLTGAQMNFSHFVQTSWKECQMPHAQFQESTLKHVEFDACDLTGAFFNGAQLEGTVFTGSSLRGADFSRASMAGCDLRRANIEEIRIAPEQLRGVIVTSDQALYLARLLGLVIRE